MTKKQEHSNNKIHDVFKPKDAKDITNQLRKIASEKSQIAVMKEKINAIIDYFNEYIKLNEERTKNIVEKQNLIFEYSKCAQKQIEILKEQNNILMKNIQRLKEDNL